MLPIQKKLISINYSKGVVISPKYIVIHETDNEDKGADDTANRDYFANHPEAEASTHFVVDDDSITQCAELNWKCWHVGDNKGHSDITNSNTIGIEICVNSDGDYNKARSNAIELTKYLMSVTGIDSSRVVRHYDASGKWCPRRMLDNPSLWQGFKESISNGKGVADYSPVQQSTDSVQAAAKFVGDRCKELQTKLIACGYDCGGYGADGDFGKGTYESLKAFQKGNGLVADGLAGAATFNKLDQIIAAKSSPSKQYDAKYLQHELNVLLKVNLQEDGMIGPLSKAAANKVILKRGSKGNIVRWVQAKVGTDTDGDYGANTASVVAAYQVKHGLTGDGVIGPATWKVLLN